MKLFYLFLLIVDVFYRGILNSTREKRADTDGLSDLQYRMVGLKQYQSYTKIQIDLRRIEVKKITLIINGNKAMEMDLDLGKLLLIKNYVTILLCKRITKIS